MPVSADSAVSISGTAHIQDVGDSQGVMQDGYLVLGSRGQSRRLESITLGIENSTGIEGSIIYRVHIRT